MEIKIPFPKTVVERLEFLSSRIEGIDRTYVHHWHILNEKIVGSYMTEDQRSYHIGHLYLCSILWVLTYELGFLSKKKKTTNLD